MASPPRQLRVEVAHQRSRARRRPRSTAIRTAPMRNRSGTTPGSTPLASRPAGLLDHRLVPRLEDDDLAQRLVARATGTSCSRSRLHDRRAASCQVREQRRGHRRARAWSGRAGARACSYVGRRSGRSPSGAAGAWTGTSAGTASGARRAASSASACSGLRPITSISDATNASPPSMQPTMSPKISRFQRAQVAATDSGSPARAQPPVDGARDRAARSASSFCRLWLTSCRIAPIVQGLTSRW